MIPLSNAYTSKALTKRQMDDIKSSTTNTVPPVVSTFLKSAGTISGKRCSCFISKNCLRKQKVLQSLMKTMEDEGMYLKLSDILKNADMAYAVGKRLHVERN